MPLVSFLGWEETERQLKMDDYYIQKPSLDRRVRAEQNPGPHEGTAFSTDRGLKDSVPWPVHHWRVEDVETGQMEVWADSDFRAQFDRVESPVDAAAEEAPEVEFMPPGESPEAGIIGDPPAAVSNR